MPSTGSSGNPLQEEAFQLIDRVIFSLQRPMRRGDPGRTGRNRSALNKAVNLKELSRRLGLSQTTVSRALNGYAEVMAMAGAPRVGRGRLKGGRDEGA